MRRSKTPQPLLGKTATCWAIGLVIISVIPALLMAAGVDLSSQGKIPTDVGELTPVEVAFRVLKGPLTHTLLEWSSFCAAMGVCCLALIRYRMVHDRSMLVIGVAFACAGTMDAFHTLAADRLISAVADNRDLIPFTWAICRVYNAVILLAGVGVFLLQRSKVHSHRSRILAIPVSCGIFALIAYGSIAYCAGSTTLPATMFADSVVKRPYDLAALLPFVIGGIFVFPRYVRQEQTIFARLLYLSLIPQIATQLYMVLGSSALFDPAFNAAHFLKAIAYLVPFAGLVLGYARTHEATMKYAVEVEAGAMRSRAIMSATTDCILVIDERGVIETCNEATESTFGYSDGELIGKNVSILASDPHQAAHDGYLAKYMRTHEANIIGTTLEVLGLRKDGSLISVRLSVNEVQLDTGTVFVGMMHDLTEEHAIEASLAQARKLESIGHLAAGIAHEINTPTQFATDNVQFLGDATKDLIGLLDAANAMADELEPSSGKSRQAYFDKSNDADLEFLLEEIPKAIEQSLEGLGSIGHIVRAMKEFSHPGGAEMDDVDLNRSIDSTITVARNEWKYVAEVKTDYDPMMPPVPLMQSEFNQVILNLVVNACHAIEDAKEAGQIEQGVITISTCVISGEAEVRVGDNGCGIEEDVRSRVFDPFFTTKEVGKGTGQGLAIANNTIVEVHGGTLSVESEVGKGTTFVIRLPLVVSDKDASEVGEAAAGSSS